MGSGRVSPRPVPRPRWRRGPAAHPTVAVHCGHTGNVARNIYRTYARAVSYVRAAGSWPRCCAVKREAKFETSSLTLGGVVYYYSVLGPTLHLFAGQRECRSPCVMPCVRGRHQTSRGRGFRVVHLVRSGSPTARSGFRYRVSIRGPGPRLRAVLRSFDREAASTDADVRSVAISDLWAITMVHVV